MTPHTHKRLTALKSQAETMLKNINSALEEAAFEPKTKLSTNAKDATEAVIAEICRYARIKEEDLLERNQSQPIVTYRKMACYILTDFCGMSLQETANRLNLSNHATVISHRDKMRAWMANERYAPHDTIIATTNILNNLHL